MALASVLQTREGRGHGRDRGLNPAANLVGNPAKAECGDRLEAPLFDRAARRPIARSDADVGGSAALVSKMREDALHRGLVHPPISEGRVRKEIVQIRRTLGEFVGLLDFGNRDRTSRRNQPAIMCQRLVDGDREERFALSEPLGGTLAKGLGGLPASSWVVAVEVVPLVDSDLPVGVERGERIV